TLKTSYYQPKTSVTDSDYTLPTGSAVMTYAQAKIGSKGHSGLPVYFDSSVAKPINYLAIHPEYDSAITLPFVNNDLAFLTKRGGTCTMAGATTTSSYESLFDGKPSYFLYTVSSLSDSVSFTIDLSNITGYDHRYSEVFYIDFGAAQWRAKDITVYFYYQDSLISGSTRQVTNLDTGFWRPSKIGVPDGSRIDKIIIVLSNFVMTTPRIAEIGLVKYNSDGVGAAYMSRGSNDLVYRDISPYTTETYNLGDSSHVWKNLYVKRMDLSNLYVDGIYRKDSASTLNVYTAGTTTAFQFGNSVNYSYHHLYPNADASYYLGSASYQWRYLYLYSAVMLQNKSALAYVSSVWGDNNTHVTLQLGNGFTGQYHHTAIYGENIDFYPNGSDRRLRVNNTSVELNAPLIPYSTSNATIGSVAKPWTNFYMGGTFVMSISNNSSSKSFLQSNGYNNGSTLLIGYGTKSTHNINYYAKQHSFYIYDSSLPSSNERGVFFIGDGFCSTTQNLVPNTTNAIQLGDSSHRWSALHANAWYPNAASGGFPGKYITLDSNGDFRVIGNLIVSGSVVAGQSGSGAVGFPVTVGEDLEAEDSTIDIGTQTVPFNHFFVKYIGNTSSKVTQMYLTTLGDTNNRATIWAGSIDATSIDATSITCTNPEWIVTWSGLINYISGSGGSSVSSSALGIGSGDLDKIIAGRISTIITGPGTASGASTYKYIFHIATVRGYVSGSSKYYTIYIDGPTRLRIEQVGSTNTSWRIYTSW
ncbi:MAG: hypothetical protein IKS71_04920, partial [Bacteroidales bacterium]|nr:hypothetical protein [Bacteroidales bacterium]